MEKIVLSRSETRSIRSVLRRVATQYASPEDPAFLKDATLHAHDLPKRVRAFLNRFRLEEPDAAVCMISGYEVDQAKIGETPSHWRFQGDGLRTLEEEILLVLFSSLLGDVFGWATQQEGRVIHDVLPIRGHQNAQIGTGSEQEITWHNEDAFHPCRGDYVALMCLRNPDRVPTTVAPVDLLELGDEIKDALFEPQFIFRPDYSHSKEFAMEGHEDGVNGHPSFERRDEVSKKSEKRAVLFGDRNSAYIQVDPYFMETPDDPEAQIALNILVAMIDRLLYEIILEPGDFCFIDNYKAVHGRRPFVARFDGTDRWLKRLNITRDLRKSRALRGVGLSRIIG